MPIHFKSKISVGWKRGKGLSKTNFKKKSVLPIIHNWVHLKFEISFYQMCSQRFNLRISFWRKWSSLWKGCQIHNEVSSLKFSWKMLRRGNVSRKSSQSHPFNWNPKRAEVHPLAHVHSLICARSSAPAHVHMLKCTSSFPTIYRTQPE